jgi:hypothetical protein
MPGTPPVKVVSETPITCTPLAWNEIVSPTAIRVSFVPAGSAPVE